jgi:hypothetical protein
LSGDAILGQPFPIQTFPPAQPDTIRRQMMKHVLFATVAMLGLATAIPAFAQDQGPRLDSANSLPSGFYDHTEGHIQAQIEQNYFATRQAEQAKHVVKGVSAELKG